MPARFDWKAEDERDWGDFQPEKGPVSGGRRRGRRALLLILALVAAAAITALVISRAGQILDGGVERAEAQLLDGHRLVLDAASAGDADLLGGLIFDRLPEWTESEQLAAEAGLLLEREPLDLHLAGAQEPVAIEVKLEPGLQRAVVTTTLRYHVGQADDAPDVVDLRHVFSYRYQDDRWLLNPPTGAFWGNWQAVSGRYLTLNFPERDEDIALRLAADLEAAVGQACHALEGMNCPEDTHIVLNMLADPATLVALSNPAWAFAGGPNVELPAPTLLGLPADEAAYRALYHAYAAQMVSRLYVRQAGFDGNHQPLLALAIVNQFLGQLGLRDRPLPPEGATYSGQALRELAEAIWDNSRPLEEQLAGEEADAATLLVAFLANEWSGAPSTQMARLLTQAGSLDEWLALLNPSPSTTFQDGWQLFLATAYPGVEPVTWPDQVVLLMCDPGVIGSSRLYQYDPARQAMSVLTSGREFIHMEPLPDGQGVVLTEQNIRQNSQQLYLWQDGVLTHYDPAGGQLGEGGNLSRPRSLGRAAGQQSLTATSIDGHWQAELNDGFLILSAPAQGYRQQVAHQGQDCQGIAWVYSPGGAQGQ